VRLKLDENISIVAGRALAELGHDVDTVASEGLVGHPDPDVIAAAVADDRALVTFDLGFGDPRAYPPGSHQGVILLRLADHSPTTWWPCCATSPRTTTSTTSPAASSS